MLSYLRHHNGTLGRLGFSLSQSILTELEDLVDFPGGKSNGIEVMEWFKVLENSIYKKFTAPRHTKYMNRRIKSHIDGA
jgi:hypothetical protein